LVAVGKMIADDKKDRLNPALRGSAACGRFE